jgi:hypothetical protein
MVWVRLEDDIADNPKLAAVDDHAFAVYVCGLAYCNRNLTDGLIPTGIGLTLRHCGGKAKQAIMALVTARLWEPVDGGWRVHDFLDYQPSRRKVETERSQKQAAGQAGGRASAIARAQANGQADSQHVLKQNPTPVPGTRVNNSLLPGGGLGGPGAARAREATLPEQEHRAGFHDGVAFSWCPLCVPPTPPTDQPIFKISEDEVARC